MTTATSTILGPAAPATPAGKPAAAAVPAGLLRAGAAPAAPGKSEHDQILSTAQKWVSQTFFGTLLKQMRESPFKSELFSGGRAGEAYTNLYDQQLADRMARGSGRKLALSITKKIEGRKAAPKTGGGSGESSGGPSGSPGASGKSGGASASSAAPSGVTSSATPERNHVATDLRA